jgi:hypothetical protein
MPSRQNDRVNTGGGAFTYGDVVTAGGDFIGRDQINQYQINSYVYQADQAEERFRKYIQGRPRPYFPDRPFTTNETRLFMGRQEEERQIVEQLGVQNQRTLLISGPADVGKSSLISAGVIPKLCEKGALIVHLNDYSHAEALIRAALLGQASQAKIKINQRATLSELVEKITSHTRQGLILILDQFERYYLNSPHPAEQLALHEHISSTLQRVAPEYFHILLAIRQDWQAHFDGEWGNELPGVRLNPVQLQSLKSQQARQAIVQPLIEFRKIPSIGEYVQYNESIIDSRLLPDLDALDDILDGKILPSDLQIVCNHLYELAHCHPEEPLINESLYLEASQGRGAERIIDLHFETLLARLPAADQSLARDISGVMLDAAPQFWLKVDEIRPEGVEPPDVEHVLAEMAEACLLIWHVVGGQKAYAFASYSIANAAYRLAGLEARRRFQSRNELKYIWRSWNTYDTLASPAQLNSLQQFSPPEEEFLPERTVLLLRSAIANHKDPAPWVERLHTPAAQAMLNRVEENRQELVDSTDRLTRYNQLHLLLGTGVNGDQVGKPGAISHTAAFHRDGVYRETATLALLAGYESDAPALLEKAVQEQKKNGGRLAELRAILADGAQSLQLFQEELEIGRLGRIRLGELDKILMGLENWLERSRAWSSDRPEKRGLQTALKKVEQAGRALNVELDSGRLDILPVEQRLHLLTDLHHSLDLLGEETKLSSAGLFMAGETRSCIDESIQVLERLERWLKMNPSDTKKVGERRENLQQTSQALMQKLNLLPAREKIQMWWMRFIRRFSLDSRYIWQLTLGGALGGGLSLGLLRAFFCIPLNQNPGFFFYNYFPMGFISGAGIALGLLLTSVVRLGPPEHGPWSAGRRSTGLALLLGMLGFTISNLLLNIILRPEILITPSLILPMALPAGLGLSLVLFDQPKMGWKLGAGQWLLRLGAVGLFFAIVQGTFILAEQWIGADNYTLGLGLVFGWSGYFFRNNLTDPLIRIGLGGITSLANWYHYPAILDSALTGIVLALGIAAGLIVADRRYRRRERRKGSDSL